MSDENINKNEELENKEEVASEQANEEKSYDLVIEEARKGLYKSYMLSRRISNILMFVIVGAIVGIMFLIISNILALKITGYVLAGVLLVGMIVYYLINRKKFPNKTREYVALVSQVVNDEMFTNNGFEDIKSDVDEKLAMDDLAGDGIYTGASTINSRNVIHGVYKKHHFLYAEAALVRPSPRKQQVPPLFVGKYISIPNDLKFDGRFVFVFKNPKQPLDLPHAVEDLEAIEDKDDFAIYGPKDSNYHTVIDNKLISQLRKLELDSHLLNVNAVFWAGHTAIYLSYDDAIMSVPFDKPVNKEAYDKSFNDLLTCFNALAE